MRFAELKKTLLFWLPGPWIMSCPNPDPNPDSASVIRASIVTVCAEFDVSIDAGENARLATTGAVKSETAADAPEGNSRTARNTNPISAARIRGITFRDIKYGFRRRATAMEALVASIA